MSSDKAVSAEAVAGLAREVDALRRAVRSLSGLPAQVEELATTVTQALDDVASAGRRGSPVVPISWLGTTGGDDQDPEPAAAWLAELADWVGRVYLPYAASDGLKDCWLWHPAVIEELACLHQAWELAYHPETGSVLAAADWHDRYRPAAAARIKQWIGGCSLYVHVGPSHKPLMRPAPSVDSIPAIAHWWTRARDQAPPLPAQDVRVAAPPWPRTVR